MRNRKFLGYLVLIWSGIFIITYLIDGVMEVFFPFKGLGFPYKPFSFYILKLIYACLFMFSGTSLLKNENHSWSLLMLSSIGILTSCGWLYFYGFIFRTTPLDLFFLEIPSFILIFLFNVNCFIKKIGIIVPHNRWILIFIFMLINFALNQCAWWFLQSSNY